MKPPPSQRCQAIEVAHCPTCKQALYHSVRCEKPATRKRLDWFVCADHLNNGVLDAHMIGRE